MCSWRSALQRTTWAREILNFRLTVETWLSRWCYITARHSSCKTPTLKILILTSFISTWMNWSCISKAQIFHCSTITLSNCINRAWWFTIIFWKSRKESGLIKIILKGKTSDFWKNIGRSHNTWQIHGYLLFYNQSFFSQIWFWADAGQCFLVPSTKIGTQRKFMCSIKNTNQSCIR